MDTEQKRKRIESIVKILALPVIGFFIAPFVFIAIKGLIGLVIAGLTSLVAIQFTPVIAAKVANWRLKALKYEASKNPVETLQNDYRKRQDALVNFSDAIKQFIAAKESFAEKLGGFKAQYPAEASKFAMQLDKMEQLLALRKQKYSQAQHSLEAYELEIKKAGAIWDMGQEAARMSEAAGMTEEDFFAKIQVETALDSVQKSMSIAFADLEVSLLDEKGNQGGIATTQPAAIPEQCGPPPINQVWSPVNPMKVLK